MDYIFNLVFCLLQEVLTLNPYGKTIKEMDNLENYTYLNFVPGNETTSVEPNMNLNYSNNYTGNFNSNINRPDSTSSVTSSNLGATPSPPDANLTYQQFDAFMESYINSNNLMNSQQRQTTNPNRNLNTQQSYNNTVPTHVYPNANQGFSVDPLISMKNNSRIKSEQCEGFNTNTNNNMTLMNYDQITNNQNKIDYFHSGGSFSTNNSHSLPRENRPTLSFPWQNLLVESSQSSNVSTTSILLDDLFNDQQLDQIDQVINLQSIQNIDVKPPETPAQKIICNGISNGSIVTNQNNLPHYNYPVATNKNPHLSCMLNSGIEHGNQKSNIPTNISTIDNVRMVFFQFYFITVNLF